MATIELDVSPDVFLTAFAPMLRSNAAEQFFYGSAGSGKSKFIFQRTILDLSASDWPDRNFLVMRNTMRSNRDSTFTELQVEAERFGLLKYFDVSRSELIMTNKLTGRMAFFRGLDDPEKLKSVVPRKGPLTDIIFEEATEGAESDYDDLTLRLRGKGSTAVKRFTMMFNPVFVNHWIRKRWATFFPMCPKRFVRNADSSTIVHHSTHADNTFLTEQDHARYEGLKDRSKYHYQVYARGEWGVLGGVILTNWSVEDLSEIAPAYEDKMLNGVDFGFSSDEAALIRCAIRPEDGTVLVFDVPVYSRNMTNDILGDAILRHCGQQVVTCDSAEPKSVVEVGQRGVTARGAKKGKDSVRHGIQWLQQRKIIIDRHRCQPLINELQQWQWKKDRRTGTELPETVDGFDHAISAMRYALEEQMTCTGAQIW